MKLFFSLLLSLFFLTSCNGQVKTDSPKKNVHEVKTISARQLKLRKTQGGNEYNNVHCGLQDKGGNLWFGTTSEGVYRFNGKTFTQFTVKDGLSSNTVWSILEDKTGNIWFGTDAGICRYNWKTINYIPITTSGNNNFLDGNSYNNSPSSKGGVGSMIQDRSGTIWFGTDSGLYCYNGKTFARFLDNQGIINNSDLTLKNVQCMLEDKKGNLWFGSGWSAMEGIVRYDGKNLEHFKPRNQGWIRNMIEEQNGGILFVTRSNDVCRYDGKSFTYVTQANGMVNGSMICCLKDKSGNTWFSSDYGTELNDTVGGVWRYDGKTFTKYSIKEGLTNNAVFLMLEDPDGNIWVGTRNTGLYRFNGKSFDSYSE